MDKLTITTSEARVLAAAQLQANSLAKEISSESGVAEHSVRYVLKKYQDNKTIIPRAVLNPELLGYTVYILFFSVNYRSQEAEQAMRDLLIQSELTVSVFDLGGDYQYGAAMYAEEISEVYDFVSELASIKGVTLVDKSLQVRISTSLLQRGYLSSKSSKVDELSFGAAKGIYRRDELDHQILRGITHTQFSSNRALARELDVSHSTVEARISKMEEAGVIVGYAYGIRSIKFGMQPSRLLIQTKGNLEAQWNKIRNFSKSHPHIVQITRLLGSFDFDLLLETYDAKQVIEITREVHDVLGADVVSIKSFPVYGYIKLDEYPFS